MSRISAGTESHCKIPNRINQTWCIKRDRPQKQVTSAEQRCATSQPAYYMGFTKWRTNQGMQAMTAQRTQPDYACRQTPSLLCQLRSPDMYMPSILRIATGCNMFRPCNQRGQNFAFSFVGV